MSVGQSKFVFNFDAEVEKAKKDFPKQTKDATFIDMSAPDAEEKLIAWAKAEGQSPTQINSLLQKMDEQSAVICTSSNGHTLIAIPVNRGQDKWAFDYDEEKSKFSVFDHELGHLVVPNAKADQSNTKSTEYREHAADTFAMMRGLKRGTIDKEDIAHLSDKRSDSLLLTGDVTHLTSISLDAMVINPKNINFLSLSDKDIIKISQEHAATFEMKEKMYSKFVSVGQVGKQTMQQQQGVTEEEMAQVVEDRMLSLADIALTSNPNSMEFYLAARVLNNAIDNGGLRYGGTEVKIDTQNEYWKSVKESINEKATAAGRDLGGRKSLEETPEITRPEQEKGFVAKVKESFTPMRI